MKKVLIGCLSVVLALIAGVVGLIIWAFWDTEDYTLDYEVDTVDVAEVATSTSASETSEKDDIYDVDWVFYWYLCGSDLETEYGSATDDIFEMLAVDLPENVQIVVQTGGAYDWWNDFVTPDKTQRFLIDSTGIKMVDEQPEANMGDADTLADFLTFCNTNFPANNVGVVLWNHGGGSVAGVAFDEVYDYDALDLNELREAFTSVYEPNSQQPPIDIIGFDACLMATIDTAYYFSDLAQYMVASEDSEPSYGWNYTGMLEAMADNPTISARDLSIAICDTYIADCEAYYVADEATLSVVNLSKMPALAAAYEAFGAEALENMIDTASFYNEFSRIANEVENYGGNSRRLGYTNMADLGQLAEKTADILPETADNLSAALQDCVEYTVAGKYRTDASGLACFYLYSGDMYDLQGYEEVGASDAFKYFYNFGLTGELAQSAMDYLQELEDAPTFTEDEVYELPDDTYIAPAEDDQPAIQPVRPLMTLDSVDWDDMPLTVNRDGCATLTLGPDAEQILTSISFELMYMDETETYLYSFGIDNDIFADWDAGVFSENFRGVWGCLDGALCYIEISYEGDGYNEYIVPVYLNGERYNLSVTYDFDDEAYYINGARKPMEDSGAIDKNLRKLEIGDQVQVIQYANVIDSPSTDMEEVLGDTITVTANTSFEEWQLVDGYYFLIFIMTDSRGNQAFSEVAVFEMENGDIYTTVGY